MEKRKVEKILTNNISTVQFDIENHLCIPALMKLLNDELKWKRAVQIQIFKLDNIHKTLPL